MELTAPGSQAEDPASVLSQGTVREKRDRAVGARGRGWVSDCGSEREVAACPPWLRGVLQRWPPCPGAQH